MENIHFGDKLRQAMNKSGLSRKKIAKKAGSSESNLYKLIKAEDIKVKTLLKLAKALDVPLQYFFEVQDSQIVGEIKQLLEQERMKNKILEEQIRFFDQQFGILIGLLRNFEKESKGPSEFLTLINHKAQEKIPLSTFIGIFHKMITSANKLPEKEKMYIKYTGEFLNIIEVRQAIKENIHLYPVEIQEIFSEFIPENAQNEYIDCEKIWKNI